LILACRIVGSSQKRKFALMKAFLIDRYKKGGALRLGQSPEPQLRENDVMVEIHAASVNPLDAKIRDGEFKLILPYRLPLVLGNDVAVSWCGSAPMSGNSNPATRSMRVPARIASAPSPSISPSTLPISP
jgi:hypothetical protein